MGAWKLEEARLVQWRLVQSAANADEVNFGAAYFVPAGKLWCVIGFGYYPSVAETQTVSMRKLDATGYQAGLYNPVQLALAPAVPATFIEQGMEYMLLPGEYISITRGNHTAGSVMTAVMQFIEIDLPLYTYDEPQVVKRQKLVLSTLRSRMGGGTRPGSMVGAAGRGTGGSGKGGAEPV